MGRTEETSAIKKNENTLEELIGSGRVDAWALCLPEREEFPDAAFLKLDWRMRGAVTRALSSGALSRKSGEVSLLPVTRPVSDEDPQTFKILTLGVKERNSITQQEISRLFRNVESLRLKSIGLSANDFGWTAAEVKKHATGLKGVEVCVTE